MSTAVVKMSDAMLWEIPDPEPNHRYMGIMFERDITPTANLASGFVISATETRTAAVERSRRTGRSVLRRKRKGKVRAG